MNAIAVTVLGGGVVSTFAGWLGYLFGVRQERSSEERARRLVAAETLTKPLRELQGLLRSHGLNEVGPLHGDEVSAAFSSWSIAWDAHGHRLPESWRHLSHSVLDAAGTVFGGVARVHTHPDMAMFPLGEPDNMWQQYADDYFDYVASNTLLWGDSSPDAPNRLLSYEEWLVKSGRREAWGHN